MRMTSDVDERAATRAALDRVCGLKDAARIAGVRPGWITDRHRRAGRRGVDPGFPVPLAYVSGLPLYYRSDIEAWLHDQEPTRTDP